MKRNGLRNTIEFVIVNAALVALCLFACNENTAQASPAEYFSAPNWQTQFNDYITTNGTVLDYDGTTGAYNEYVPALHFHGRMSDSTANGLTFTASGLTVNATNANVFDFHGNPNLNYLWDNANPDNMLEIGGIAVTNSNFTFDNNIFNLNGSSIGTIFSMTSSIVNIQNTQFNFTGSNNAAIVVPQFIGDGGPNTINIDSATTFNFGNIYNSGGNNTAVAIGADDTLLNFAGTLNLQGDSDRGLYLRGAGINVNGVGTGTGGLTININSSTGGQGIVNSGHYYDLDTGTASTTNTVTGATIHVGQSVNLGGRIWAGNVGVINGQPSYYYGSYADSAPYLIVADSTLTVGANSIGMLNYDILEVINSTITATGNGSIAIKNGFDDSIHLIEQPELVYQIQYYDNLLGMWVPFTDDTPPLLPGQSIRYRLAIAPEEDGGAYGAWGSGHWTTALLGDGYEIGEDSIKVSDAATAIELPEPPDVEESYLHTDLYSGESLVDADAVLIVDSTTINASNIAIENHGTVTIQNGSKITAGNIGILSEYVQNVAAVTDPDMFVYLPYYYGIDNNITVNDSVITGAGSTAIKTQVHQFYRIAAEDDEDAPPTGPEGGFYSSLYEIGWMGGYYNYYYYEDEGDIYDIFGRNIDIINGSRLGEKPVTEPGGVVGGVRVGTGIDFSGDLHDIYIDSTSEINATQFGIRSTGAPFYGWDDKFPQVGSFAGTMSRITIEGQVSAGTPGGQQPIVGTDPITHRPLAYDLSDPAIYAMYVTVNTIVNPITGATTQVLTPAIDPRTGRPYVDPRTGVQIVTIRNTAASGTGIAVTGDSIAWDVIGGPDDDAWSGYFGPVVSEINVIGENSLLEGGYAAIEIDTIGRDNTTHVGKILSGRNAEMEKFDELMNSGGSVIDNANILNNRTVAERAMQMDVLDTNGIKGDIISWYNGVAGWVAEDGTIRVSNATELEGGFAYEGYGSSFGWWQVHDGTWTSYFETIGGNTVAEADFKSKLFGHRDLFPINDSGTFGDWWTTVPQGSPAGRSVVLDEILLQWDFAENSLHFVDALGALLQNTDVFIEDLTGLSKADVEEGLTRDGTLLKFAGDIFSGDIWGGGFGSKHTVNRVTDRQGNIDLQFTSFTMGEMQTSIFNNNTSYVRNVAVKADGHLIMNDATFIVDQYTGNIDATRLIIHDFINEGILSGNGTLQLSQRGTSTVTGLDVYEGFLVNLGTLAPGLPGVLQTPGLELRPGGQFGEIDITGSVTLRGGTYEYTIGKDSYGEIFSYWANYMRTVPQTVEERSRQLQFLTETYGTELQWFSSPVVPDGADPLTAQMEWLSNPANITDMDRFLMRFGRSDFLNVHIGTFIMGGVLQVDDIYDADTARGHRTNFVVAASDIINGQFDLITSETRDLVYANVIILPPPLPTGQAAAVLTLVDDAHWYEHRNGGNMSYNEKSVASALDDAMQTAPGLAQSLGFGINTDAALRDVMRQMAGSVRANAVMMNVWSPNEAVFNQIGYGQGGMSTGSRGDLVYQDQRTGRMTMPYGRPAVPPPGQQFASPPNTQIRGQSPFYRSGSIWGNYTHSSFITGDDDNSYKFRYDRDGVIIGSEWNLAPSWALGGVAMMNTGKLKQVSDEVKSQDYNIGFYVVGAPYEQFEFKSYIGFGFQSYKSDRYIRNSDVFIMFRGNGDSYGIDDHYDSDANGCSFNYALELARPFRTSPNFVLRPSAGFDVQVISQEGYSEQLNAGQGSSWSNNGLNMSNGHLVQKEVYGTYGLDYQNLTYSRVTGRLGVSTESYFARGGWQFRGYYSSRLWGDKYPESDQRFISGGKSFNIRGTELGNDYFTLGLGTHLWLNRERTATLFIDYDANIYMEHGANRHIFNIGLQQSF
jgi:hypothetical protein